MEVFHCENEIPLPKNTTVYVGKIADTCEIQAVNYLLRSCGLVKNWKRASDPVTNKLKHFGFCEFGDTLACIKALRVLNGLEVDGQALLVKPNAATSNFIESFKAIYRKNFKPAAPPTAVAAAKGEGESEGLLLRTEEDLEDEKYDCVKLRKDIASYLAQRRKKGEVDTFLNDLSTDRQKEKEKQETLTTAHFAKATNGSQAFSQKVGADATGLSPLSSPHQKSQNQRNQNLFEKRLRQLEQEESRRRASMKRLAKALEEKERERRLLLEKEERRKEDGEWDQSSESEQDYQDGEYYRSSRKRGSQGSSRSKPHISSSKSSQRERRRAKRRREIEEDDLDRRLEKEEKERQRRREKEEKLTVSAKMQRKPKVSSNVFGAADSEDEQEEERKKLVPIKYTQEEKEAVAHLIKEAPSSGAAKMNFNAEDLMAQIPVEKDKVFAYPIDWTMYSKVSPQVSKWILSKTVELLGEEEQSLCEFISSKLEKEHVSASEMMKELEPILEDESEVFALKLYRMIIYSVAKCKLNRS